MSKRLLAAFAIAVLVASIVVGCGEGEGSPCSTLTTLSATEGDVFVMKTGTDTWVEGQGGTELEEGDAIQTGEDSSAEITFFDGSTVELQPDTEVEITSLDLSCDTGVKTITLEQIIGATISRVINIVDPASSYEVESSSGAAAVRGSILVFVVTGNGTAWVANQEGNIWTRAQGVELQVPEKRKCILRPLFEPQLLPPNRSPLAGNDTFATGEHNPIDVPSPGVLLNDWDLDPWDLLLVTALNTSGTAGAVTRWGPRGAFTYDPDGQFDYLQAGNSTTDSFTYTVSDACGDSATATVTITINGVD
jgi:VCBS repeat-containing protein